jgi:hypothetical protein
MLLINTFVPGLIFALPASLPFVLHTASSASAWPFTLLIYSFITELVILTVQPV